MQQLSRDLMFWISYHIEKSSEVFNILEMKHASVEWNVQCHAPTQLNAELAGVILQTCSLLYKVPLPIPFFSVLFIQNTGSLLSIWLQTYVTSFYKPWNKLQVKVCHFTCTVAGLIHKFERFSYHFLVPHFLHSRYRHI